MADVNKLQELVSKVNCPKKAMSIEGDEVFCNCAFTLFKKEITKVSLGNISQDILRNCGECKLKMERDEDKKPKLIPIDEFHEVSCPAQMGQRTQALDCGKCPYFDSTLLNELEKKSGEGAAVREVRCGYPRISIDNLKVRLDNKQKKILKEEKAKMKAATPAVREAVREARI